MTHEKEVHRSGLYYVIPAELMDSDELEPIAKLLYCLLSGLSDQNGKCFPSDEYLASRLHVSLRKAQDLVLDLEKLSLIKRETHRLPNNPFKRQRIITIQANFKKCLPNAQPCVSDNAQMRVSVTSPGAVIVSEVKRVSEEEGGEGKKKKNASPLKIQIPKEKRDRLNEIYSEEVVDAYVKKLELYAELKPQKFKEYKSHAAVIETWLLKDGVRKIARNEKSKEDYAKEASSGATVLKNIKLSASLASNFAHLVKSGDLTVSDSMVVCRANEGHSEARFAVSDIDFAEKLKNEFEKREWIK